MLEVRCRAPLSPFHLQTGDISRINSSYVSVVDIASSSKPTTPHQIATANRCGVWQVFHALTVAASRQKIDIFSTTCEHCVYMHPAARSAHQIGTSAGKACATSSFSVCAPPMNKRIGRECSKFLPCGLFVRDSNIIQHRLRKDFALWAK